MTTAIPTAVSLRMRFREFSEVEDSVLEFAIEEARADTEDASNFAVNGDLALVYLSAHYVACSLQNSSSGGSGGTGAIASESIGRISVTYTRDATKPEATADDKESTSYGRRYLEIVGGNFSGPVIV